MNVRTFEPWQTKIQWFCLTLVTVRAIQVHTYDVPGNKKHSVRSNIKAIFSYFSNVFIKETCIPTRFLLTMALIFVKKSPFGTELLLRQNRNYEVPEVQKN